MTGQPLARNTVEALARGWYNEAQMYGFQRPDLVRFVNTLLQLSINDKQCSEHSSLQLPVEETECQEHDLPISTDSFSIRKAEQHDHDQLASWLDEQDGSAFLRSRLTTTLLTLDDVLQSESHAAGIITLPDGSPIGCLAFLDVDRIQGKAELRKLIGPASMRGKGYAKAATKAWLQYGFTSLGLQKIYLNSLCSNLRNIRINRELGFSVEGVFRNELFLDGQYHDIMRMALYKTGPLP